MRQSLPFSKQIVYAFGMMRGSIVINLISVILIYLYAPPSNRGLPTLISPVVFFGFFNLISLITTSGRFADAIFDPMIAQLSDKSKNPRGRRIPFMKFAILPSLVFCFFVLYPLHSSQST